MPRQQRCNMTAYTLNLLDLAFTLHALGHGAVELNPLLRCVPLMIVYKVVILGALLGWLGKREDKPARIGLGICTAAFAAVDIYHIYFIFGGAL